MGGGRIICNSILYRLYESRLGIYAKIALQDHEYFREQMRLFNEQVDAFNQQQVNQQNDMAQQQFDQQQQMFDQQMQMDNGF